MFGRHLDFPWGHSCLICLCSCMKFFLWVSLCINVSGDIFSCSKFLFLVFPTPTITFLMVRCCSFWLSGYRHASHSVEPWERGDQECTAISQDFTAFRERSYKRTINILWRSSSNAFFLRSAALGKSCILNKEYFIESAWSLYSIRQGCWSTKNLMTISHCSMVIWVWTRAWNVHCYVMVFNTTELLRYEKAHFLRLLVSAACEYTRSMVIFKYPATCLHPLEWQAC